MKYKIVIASTARLLEEQVNKLMKNHGWEPLGGVGVTNWADCSGDGSGNRHFEYSQILINQSEL